MFLTAFTLYTVIAILIADAVASEVATHIVPRIRERSDILVKMGPYSVVLFGVYGLLSLIGYQAPHPAIVLMWAIINAVIIAIIEMGFNELQFYPEYETSIRVTARIKTLLTYVVLFGSYAMLFPYQLMH